MMIEPWLYYTLLILAGLGVGHIAAVTMAIREKPSRR